MEPLSISFWSEDSYIIECRNCRTGTHIFFGEPCSICKKLAEQGARSEMRKGNHEVSNKYRA